MSHSRFIQNPFEDYKDEFADQIPTELAEIKRRLEFKEFFLPYLQVAPDHPSSVYVGRYGVLLFYFFLQKKFPQFRDRFLSFYSQCIGKCFHDYD